MEVIPHNVVQKEADIFREKLIADLPVKEHQLQVGEILTTYLEGGEGTPLVLLHGPGESAIWWMRVIPDFVKNFKVIVPDLPGHGSSQPPHEKLIKKIILDWLDEFLDKTCTTPPILIGHVVGGAIAARYAAQPGIKLKQLVLVDSLGLSSFRPAPLFAFGLIRFMIRPVEKTYLRFLPQCIYDVKALSSDMGRYWKPFLEYNICSAKDPEKKEATKAIMGAMSGKIPQDILQKINIPVVLVWGRHDKANRLKVAIKASEKYRWPLHIIEDARDDPKLEKPEEFVRTIQSLMAIPAVEKQE
jgi:pimeloyl-ACP methyl ester carboxylesterase